MYLQNRMSEVFLQERVKGVLAREDVLGVPTKEDARGVFYEGGCEKILQVRMQEVFL